MIVAAVMVTDSKLYSLLDCLKAIVANPEVDHVYLNIQSDDIAFYTEAIALVLSYGKHLQWDLWNVYSSWLTKRQFDQDNDARLSPIITARNMALDYAYKMDASHILFVDSDVIIRPDGLKRLLRIDKPLVGGNVPGRGAHSHVRYIYGVRYQEGNWYCCEHGTMGYCLIRRDVFEFLRFRQGHHPNGQGNPLSEDPAFSADAQKLGLADAWWIDYAVIAEHRDDPDNPLTIDQAINDYEVPK